MATIDITDVRPNRNRFIEDRPNPPAELWAPPLAPDGTMASGHVLLGEDTIYAALGDEDPFQLPEPNNVSQTFGSRRNLIAGTSIIAVSTVAGLTYFFLFLASPGSKTPGETALQSASATSAQAALDVPAPPSPTRAQSSSETSAAVPEPSRGASSASPSPDVPVSLTANASAQVAPSAMTPSREFRLFAASRRKHQICTVRKRACSWDCAEGHVLHGYKPGRRLGPGRKPQLEGLDQFPVSSA